MTATQAFDAFVAAPRAAGVFCDFDGTLSPIVDDPAAARPGAGAVEVLTDLARRLNRVGVISGRPVAFLEPLFPPGVLLAGLYGLETSIDGVRRDHPQSGTWREVVDDVAASSVARGPAGMRVESKGLSLTLHYRMAPHLEHDVRAWAEQQGARSGLIVRPARMSYELHPPIEADKGTTLLELAAGLAAVCFIGDDVGDLPAFDALDDLALAGAITVGVAVRSLEEDRELIERADLCVDDPEGAIALLREFDERLATAPT
jgi:trehalose 6-phosphate phosphatase